MKHWSSIPLGFCLALSGGVAHAQAPPSITSSGLNTQISAPVNLPGGAVQHNITGGTRPGGGANLFHSFGAFGVPANNVANFLNDSALPTNNILSRVTGGNPSNILGTIQTEGFGNANLFLMNPAGIVFGQNATLHVGGAAFFTTADYLRLDDGVQFTALPGAQDALLSVAPVAAFGFLGNNPASISVDGSALSVEDGQTLSLVGGDIPIGGGLSAPGGKIAIVSVASPGEVLADTFANAPNVNGESFTKMGNISLTEGAILDVSADGAGTVIIRGGELMMTNAVISADTVNQNGDPVAIDIDVMGDVSFSTVDGPALTARTSGNGNAGDIKLSSGGAMDISGTGLVEFQFPLIDTHTSGPGNAGNVTINSKGDLTAEGDVAASVYLASTGTEGFDTGEGGDLSITAQNFDGAQFFIGTGNIFSSNLGIDGAAPAGDVTISATGRINLSFTEIIADSADFFFNTGGDAGNVSLSASEIHLEATNITANGLFRGGNVTINTDNLMLSQSTIGTQTNTQAGGAVTVNGKTIELVGSSILSSTNQNADAGPITITATEGLSLLNLSFPFTDGPDVPSSIASNSFSGDGTGILGAPGPIRMVTPNLVIDGGSKINSSSGSSGNGGPVIINADKIFLSGQTNRLNVGDLRNFGQFQSSGIFTGSLGGSCNGPCGNAGKVTITTKSMVMEKGAQVNSSTISDGKGGEIIVNVSDTISITGRLKNGSPGGVLSQTTGTDPGAGEGGKITITAGHNIFLNDGATVSASSSGPGQAGDIAIDVTGGSFALTQGSVVNSGTTGSGAGGAITVNASDNISISGTLNGKRTGVLSQTTGAGAGGTISLMAGQNFTLGDGATVSASSKGPGDAGNINITGHDTILIDKATVTTEATQASGGEIKLTANDTIQLVDSTIESTVKGDARTVAGNIELDPDFIILQNSHILAKAVDGQGGNIKLIASKGVLVDAQSTLEVTSERGISGTVNIESPIQVLSGTIVPLPDQPVNVATLYAARCVAGEGGHFSTFVDSKSDSVAPTPGTFLASPFLPQVSSSPAGALGHSGTPSGVYGKYQTPPLQMAAYSPPVLFGQGDENSSFCP